LNPRTHTRSSAGNVKKVIAFSSAISPGQPASRASSGSDK